MDEPSWILYISFTYGFQAILFRAFSFLSFYLVGRDYDNEKIPDASIPAAYAQPCALGKISIFFVLNIIDEEQ